MAKSSDPVVRIAVVVAVLSVLVGGWLLWRRSSLMDMAMLGDGSLVKVIATRSGSEVAMADGSRAGTSGNGSVAFSGVVTDVCGPSPDSAYVSTWDENSQKSSVFSVSLRTGRVFEILSQSEAISAITLGEDQEQLLIAEAVLQRPYVFGGTHHGDYRLIRYDLRTRSRTTLPGPALRDVTEVAWTPRGIAFVSETSGRYRLRMLGRNGTTTSIRQQSGDVTAFALSPAGAIWIASYTSSTQRYEIIAPHRTFTGTGQVKSILLPTDNSALLVISEDARTINRVVSVNSITGLVRKKF